MHSNKSQTIAKNTGFLYFRMLFNLAVTLYTSRVVLEVLGVEDFGIYNVTGGVIAMFFFLTTSLSSSTQRFLTFEMGREGEGKLERVFNVSFSIHMIIAGLIIILGETIGLWFVQNKLVIPEGRMHAALAVYHLSIVMAVLGIINVPFTALIIARERMNVFAIVSIVETCLRLLIVFVLLVIAYDKLILYAVLSGLVSFLIFLIYQVVCRKNFSESRLKKLIWDKDLFKQIGGFAVWVMNGNLAVMGYTQGLNILLNLFFGPSVNAARGIGVQVQNAVTGFSSNFQTSINPQITKSYASGDLAYMHKLIITGSKLSFLLLFMISLPIVIEANFVLNQWLVSVPEYSVSFVRLTLVIALITTLSHSLIVSVHATGKLRKFQLIEGTILLLIVPIAYWCLKLGYPPECVYVIHLLVAVVAQIARIVIVLPMINMSIMDYINKIVLRIIPSFFLAVLITVIPFYYMDENWLRLFMVCLAAGFSVVALSYTTALDTRERDVLTGLVKSFIK
ncbi:lipopolysaccharide biosynthesis protein [Sphingobacterium sp. UT-1RO-CII-1]|uniref:lipopolysaccharide biosynthesis protein n=1 Tax=Sphingobacterium sp. UT-1RO-CII-1 TaxID=2995225 RepID=UPI00227CBA04|nr:lipopolysaccharide biosynthesis protein [Sphingobacterium sp. UT-1RO-CII-1]MCY4778541.1 lipopolysaccharide biosynthesis protein [Sphingobacterium sp. UT-1RO-CII-1]